ncbi:MAG: GTPase HflX [bacterium]
MEISSIDTNGFEGVDSVAAVALDGWRVTGEELEEELMELGHLVSTAGAAMEDVILQERNKPDPGTLVGSGKVEELAESAEANGYEMFVFNETLKPAQHNALSDRIPVKVLDRTDLILEIFAQRAQSRDAKLQVELAQLQHNLPRKRGWGWALARLGGGIGTRGPGEQKSTIKERDIRERIHRLKDEIEEIRENRRTQRKRRQHIPEVSLVGYTNAGKTTLLDSFSPTDTRKENQLFATLDTKTRRVHLEGDRYFLMTDTVGFIQRMPDKLQEAFKATMEEIGRSDCLMHLIDVSSTRVDDKIETVNDVLKELDLEGVHKFRVFNKIDQVDQPVVERFKERFPEAYFVSATEGTGLTKLKEDIYRYFLDNGLVDRPDYAENIPLEGAITA